VAKPILLWRDGESGELSPRRPDVFEVVPNTITAQHVETLVSQGYEVFILEHYPPGHVIFCERHGGPMPDIMYREVNGNEYTEG